MNIVITGPTGVGKSTQCKAVLDNFDADYIYEYIDSPDGPAKLQKWCTGEWSTAMFQNYIAEHWRTLLAKSKRPIRVLERLLEEGYYIFDRT